MLDPELRHRVLTALGAVDARALRLRAEAGFAGVTRHLPGKHDQSSHGRKGAKGVAKKAIGKGVDKVAEILERASDIIVDRDPATIRFRAHDRELVTIARSQGFDGPPKVVSDEEMDAAIRDGWTEAWRGVRNGHRATAAQINETFRTGDYRPGLGLFGSGYYTSADRRTAEAYRGANLEFDRDYKVVGYSGGDDGGLVRVAVSPEARTIDHARLVEEMRTTRERWQAEGALDDDAAYLLADAGRFAAASGYDVIHVRGRSDGVHIENWPDQYVVLNRSVLMVDQPEGP